MESKPVPVDEGEKIPMKDIVMAHIPVQTQFPDPNERIYYNANTEKPKRKISKLPISFGKLTE